MADANDSTAASEGSDKVTKFMYSVTAQRPTATHASVTGNFTGPDDLNLILAKNSKIEIHLVSPEGLRHVLDVNIYGIVTCMQIFRPKGEKQDALFVLTKRFRVFIIGYKCDTREIITKTYGDIEDSIGKVSDMGSLGLVDPDCKLIGLRLYEGLLKVVPLDFSKSKELKAFNIRIEELQIIDIKFLEGCRVPTIVYIYQAQKGTRHVKTFEISLSNKEFTKGPWKLTNVEANASLIIPVKGPLYGAIIIGLATVSYCKADTFISQSPSVLRNNIITTYCPLDSNRFLLADDKGRLYMLFLIASGSTADTTIVTDIKMEVLGETTIASCLSYLDNSVLFVGSCYGDSQLVQINTGKSVASDSYVRVLESFANLGPILDMCVVDVDRQGQLVTCSGNDKEGSLRVVRCGIGIQELASIDLPGLKGIWPLQINEAVELGKDNAIVITFVGQTRILHFDNEDEVEEIEIKGFITDQQTLYSGSVAGENIIQVCPKCIRLIDSHTLLTISEWKPAEGRSIDKVGCNKTQCVVASSNKITYLTLTQGLIKEVKSVTLEYEVACVDITPLKSGSDSSDLCAIGCWTDISIRILTIPGLEPVQIDYLGGEIIPRSTLMCPIDDATYLMVAMGDGSLFYFDLDPNTGNFSKKKNIALGTQPMTLQLFHAFGANHVFACSDRPTVVYHSSHKLVFSNVNQHDICHMCPLNTSAYPDALALASTTGLTVGSVAEIQKLHIQTIPLGETAKRIAYQENSQTFGIITERDKTTSRPSVSTLCSSSTSSLNVLGGNIIEADTKVKKDQGGDHDRVHNVIIMDAKSYEVLHVHTFPSNEWAMSIFSYEAHGKHYYVVGTAYVQLDEPEPKDGRLLVFRWNCGTFNLVAYQDVKGSVYSLGEVCGRIMAGINNKVTLFEFNEEEELKNDCKYHNTILSLYLRSRGEFILVGDLMRSMALLAYKPLEGRLEDIAKDYKANWMTQVEILDDDTFIGAEHSANVFVCTKEGEDDEDRRQLKLAGQYHVGEFINVFRIGSLVMRNTGQPLVHKSLLYGSASGAIGILGCITEPLYNLLKQMETNLSNTIASVGHIPHALWRSFHNERQTEASSGFIDGDHIETFLDLPRSDMKKICSNLMYDFDSTGINREANVDDLVKLVEELARIH